MKNCKILRIDLSSESVATESSEPYTDRFLGGRGVNSMLLLEGLAPGTDALDPGNPIIFGVGPLAGMTFPDGSNAPLHRMEVTSKSPETGLLGSSNIGGGIGLAVRRAGYSHIVVTGKAKKPSYLWIHDDQVEVRDASQLWGKDTYDTEDVIHEEIDREAQVICIGPAGENLVRFASVRHKEKREARSHSGYHVAPHQGRPEDRCRRIRDECFRKRLPTSAVPCQNGSWIGRASRRPTRSMVTPP